MARRKIDTSLQVGFDLPAPVKSTDAPDPPIRPNNLSEATASAEIVAVSFKPIVTESFDVDELDDYIDDEPRIRLVDPPRESPRVIVEAVGSVFEVSRLRDNGSTVACVMWTRSELEELYRRITAALEVSK